MCEFPPAKAITALASRCLESVFVVVETPVNALFFRFPTILRASATQFSMGMICLALVPSYMTGIVIYVDCSIVIARWGD